MSIDDLAQELIDRSNAAVDVEPIDTIVTDAINAMARSLYDQGAEMRTVMCGQLLHAALLSVTIGRTEEQFIKAAQVAFRAFASVRKRNTN